MSREFIKLLDSVVNMTASFPFMKSGSRIQSCAILTRCLSARESLGISPSGNNISAASIIISRFSFRSLCPDSSDVRESRQNCLSNSSAMVGLPIASLRYISNRSSADSVVLPGVGWLIASLDKRLGLVSCFHKPNALLNLFRSVAFRNLMGPFSS